MTDREPEVGHELVLDNRKLIIVLPCSSLSAAPSSFWGSWRRRQGFQDGMQTAVETAPGSAPMVAENPAPPSAAVPKEEIAASDLDWYRNVNRSEGDPAAAPRLEPAPKPAEVPAPKPAAAPAPKPAPKPAPARPASARQAESTSYSVQVGAFRARREAESVGRDLREKGFTSRIEVPGSADGLYLVKVGKFATRAEAAAMQLRLKNSGFQCFIKTN